MGLPYTHSGVRASALAMDKEAAKAVFAAAGLPVARSRVVSPEELEAGDPLPLPYVVKPVNEGSSVGVEVMLPGGCRSIRSGRPATAASGSELEIPLPKQARSGTMP